MGAARLHSQHSDLLWAGRSRDRIPVRARFSAATHTGPGAQLTHVQWVQGPFPQGQSSWVMVLTTYPYLVPI
jgi:hypothetical protein